jgi:hypothetical protein
MESQSFDKQKLSQLPDGPRVRQRQRRNSDPAVVRAVDPMNTGQPSGFRSHAGVVWVEEQQPLAPIHMCIGHHLIHVGLPDAVRRIVDRCHRRALAGSAVMSAKAKLSSASRRWFSGALATLASFVTAAFMIWLRAISALSSS